MISSMITRTRIWFDLKKGVTIDELTDFVFRFALNGIQTAKEREERERAHVVSNDREKRKTGHLDLAGTVD